MIKDSLTREISREAGWSVVLGFLTVALGIAMIVYPLATATISTVLIGCALLVVAVAQAFWAFTSRNAGGFFLKLLFGVLYGIAGLLILAFPPGGVLTLTVVLGATLIAQAILEGALAFALPQVAGRGAVIFSALCSLALGVVIFVEWPLSAVWAIGTLMGVGVLTNGITRIVISGVIRRTARQLDRQAAAA